MSRLPSQINSNLITDRTPLSMGCRVILACICLIIFGFNCELHAQEKVDLENIIDEEPFDLITLTQESGGESVKVERIDFPGGKKPASPDPNSELEVTLLIYPDRRYRVFWRDIASIRTYEEMLLERANTLLAAQDYANAFEYLNKVIQEYPQAPMLRETRQRFLMQSAEGLVSKGEYAHALAVLEEIRRSEPNLDPQNVENAVSKVASQLIEQYYKNDQLEIAQQMVQRLEIDYGDKIPAVKEWKAIFTENAKKYGRDAVALANKGQFELAYEATLRMLEIDPNIRGGAQLLAKLDTAHPTLRVGVFQKSNHPDPTSLGDWPSRRMGALVSQPLFEFQQTGPEGGVYNFVLGSFEESADETEVVLRFRPDLLRKANTPNAFNVGQWMLAKADPYNNLYDPGWASIFKSVDVDGEDYLRATLRQSHVLPYSFLQWPLDEITEESKSTSGLYRLEETRDDKLIYTWNREDKPEPRQPVDVVEKLYVETYPAIADLLKGRIDVIDRLFPSDAKLLANDRRIRVEKYALPIVHMLVPIADDPYLNHIRVRRAMLYAIDRESILQNELLGGPLTDESRLISGPFPKGTSDNDPLSYAYNDAVPITAYDLNLAKFLVEITKNEFVKQAEKTKKPAPEMREYTLGVPDYEAAKVAGEVFVTQWALIGIKAKVVVMTEGNEQVDIKYVSASVWEPAVDAERLLGEGGIAQTDNPYIVQALTRLRLARNWRTVRLACQDLHELVNSHLPILPLWQVGEMFAYRADIAGVPKKPVTLYQNLQRWRLNRSPDAK